MTLEQALAFKIHGKALRDMSESDWAQWRKRIRAEYEMLVEMDERHISAEEDRHLHAVADRLADLQEAIRVVFAPRA